MLPLEIFIASKLSGECLPMIAEAWVQSPTLKKKMNITQQLFVNSSQTTFVLNFLEQIFNIVASHVLYTET